MAKRRRTIEDRGEEIYRLTQWQLIRRKFSKHKVAVIGMWVLVLMYLVTVFAQVVAPVPTDFRETKGFQPPQRLHFVDAQGKFQLRPFVYVLDQKRDPKSFAATWVEDTTKPMPLRFLSTRGSIVCGAFPRQVPSL